MGKLDTDGDQNVKPTSEKTANGKEQGPWRRREFWLAKNGALCYRSEKDNREIMYYRPEDMRTATIRECSPGECHFEHAFELTRASQDGVGYASGYFGAEDAKTKNIFLGAIQKYQSIAQRRREKK